MFFNKCYYKKLKMNKITNTFDINNIEQYIKSNNEIICYIIDRYIAKNYDLNMMFCEIMKNILLKKINDEKFIKITTIFFDETPRKSNYSPNHLLYDFLFLFFEYLTNIDYIIFGKKAKIYTSMFKLIFDLYDESKERPIESFNGEELYKKLDIFIIDNIIKKKNDELFFYMLIEAERLDERIQSKYDEHYSQSIPIAVFEHFESKYYEDVKNNHMFKSMKMYNIIKSKKNNLVKKGLYCGTCPTIHKCYYDDHCYSFNENEYANNKKMFESLK